MVLFLMALDSISEKIKDVLALLPQGLSIEQACKSVSIGSSTFYRELQSNEELWEKYARMREARADWRFEDLENTIQELRQGLIDPNTARVIIDTRKWQMGKEKAKVYGDKQPEQVATVTNNMIITSQVLDLLGQDQLEALRVKLALPSPSIDHEASTPES